MPTFRKIFLAADAPNVDDDPVASAVLDLMREEPVWKGTTSALLTKLSSLIGERQANAKDWPTEARGLTGRLQNPKASLRRIGIDFSYYKRGSKGRKLHITYTPPESEQTTHTTRATGTSC